MFIPTNDAPYDVQTGCNVHRNVNSGSQSLDDQLTQAETISEVAVKTVVVDLGYRGQHETGAKVIHRGRKLSNREKTRLKRRSTIEAMIGHMKNDGLLGRCCLKGVLGDALHAILCGIGHNLRLIRNYWKALILSLYLSLIVERDSHYKAIVAF